LWLFRNLFRARGQSEFKHADSEEVAERFDRAKQAYQRVCHALEADFAVPQVIGRKSMRVRAVSKMDASQNFKSQSLPQAPSESRSQGLGITPIVKSPRSFVGRVRRRCRKGHRGLNAVAPIPRDASASRRVGVASPCRHDAALRRPDERYERGDAGPSVGNLGGGRKP
jgi:hypothetical protein